MTTPLGVFFSKSLDVGYPLGFGLVALPRLNWVDFQVVQVKFRSLYQAQPDKNVLYEQNSIYQNCPIAQLSRDRLDVIFNNPCYDYSAKKFWFYINYL